MLAAFDRMKVQKKVFEDDFGTIDIAVWIIVPKNRPHKH